MNERKKYYLGLDNGGTTTKAALFTPDGKEIAVARVDTASITVQSDFAERDMEEMWRANCAVIRHVLAKSGVQNTDIAGVGICGHGKGLYLWGKNGKPVRNGILSSDNRAYEYSARWQKDGTEHKAFELSCQHVLACQPVALLAWLRDRESDSYADIQWVFECKDYVRFRMTGKACAELTDYSGSGLINLHTRSYDPALLKLFGIEAVADKLPPLCRSSDVCGVVTEEAAKECGLAAGTPVIGGMFDIDSCALAAGVVDETKLIVVAGTWSINGYIAAEPVTDGSVRMNSLFCIPDRYFIEESSATSAGNLTWVVQELFPELIEKAERNNENVYKRLDETVASVLPQEHLPLYLPFVMGSNAHPNAKACFLGISASHKRAHVLRSVYEGIVFCHRVHIDRLAVGAQKPFSVVRLTGGAANSPLWAQMFADILGLPVEITDAHEAGALGCAMAVSAAVGDSPSLAAASEKMCRIVARFEPDVRNKNAYDARYALYKKAAELLNPLWDDFQHSAVSN